jgi:hypothetical protein
MHLCGFVSASCLCLFACPCVCACVFARARSLQFGVVSHPPLLPSPPPSSGRLRTLEARATSLVAQCSIYELTSPGVIPSEGHNPQVTQAVRERHTTTWVMMPSISWVPHILTKIFVSISEIDIYIYMDLPLYLCISSVPHILNKIYV